MKRPAERSLDTRALNRALLARQWLLSRVKKSASETIEHLVGLQAQVPNVPHLGTRRSPSPAEIACAGGLG